MTPALEFRDVSLCFGEKVVLSHLDLSLEPGAHSVLMGASGRGKTSALRLAAGLLAPTSGRVLLYGQPAGRRNPARVSYQFQEPRLLPWLTAAENVNVVLSDRRATLPQAKELLARFGLEAAVDLYPAELSGGMAQRVALCRALAAPSSLLLLDEPFRGLDVQTKEEILSLVQEMTTGQTLLLVTHDPDEAARFSTAPIRLS